MDQARRAEPARTADLRANISANGIKFIEFASRKSKAADLEIPLMQMGFHPEGEHQNERVPDPHAGLTVLDFFHRTWPRYVAT